VERPHGGVRPFHQKSICLAQLTLGRYAVQIWSRNTLELRGDETRVLHRVDAELTRIAVEIALYQPDVLGREGPDILRGSATTVHCVNTPLVQLGGLIARFRLFNYYGR